MKPGMYAMARETISTAYFINPSHQSVYLPTFAKQRLGKNVTAATNTHNNIIIVGLVLCAVRFVSKESRRLDLPRTLVFTFRCSLRSVITVSFMVVKRLYLFICAYLYCIIWVNNMASCKNGCNRVVHTLGRKIIYNLWKFMPD
jgi:hypothetical protein